MATVVRGILAVVAGVAVGVGLIMAVEGIGHRVYPPPEMEPDDMAAIAEYVANVPLLALLFVPFAWLVGTTVATYVARMVAPGHSTTPGHVAEGLLLLAGVSMLLTFPHPTWMWIVGIAAFPIGGWIGMTLATPRATGSASDAGG